MQSVSSACYQWVACDWMRGDFDDIPNEGQRLYKDYLHEGLANNSLLYFDTLVGREVIQVGGRRVRVEINFIQYGATIGHVAGHVYGDYHHPLETSLAMIFEQCSKAMIIIEAAQGDEGVHKT